MSNGWNRSLWATATCLLNSMLPSFPSCPFPAATFGVLFPQTPDNRVLHAAVAVALSIRPSSQRTTPSVSSSSPARTARPLSRPLRSATDDEPTSSSPSLWAKALRQLLRPKYVDLPSSWAEGLVNMLWDAGVGLLGVAFLGELQQLRHGRAGSTGGRVRGGGHRRACTCGAGVRAAGAMILEDTDGSWIRGAGVYGGQGVRRMQVRVLHIACARCHSAHVRVHATPARRGLATRVTSRPPPCRSHAIQPHTLAQPPFSPSILPCVYFAAQGVSTSHFAAPRLA